MRNGCSNDNSLSILTFHNTAMWIHPATHVQSKSMFPLVPVQAPRQINGPETSQARASPLTPFQGTSSQKSQRLRFPLNIPLPSGAQHLSSIAAHAQPNIEHRAAACPSEEVQRTGENALLASAVQHQSSACIKEPTLLISPSSTSFLERNSIHYCKIRTNVA